ncbi:hypothetical protein [Acetivibrio ethanolgignens]|uniref:Zinc-ribbon domain-containing protein n=1 Tax=Acetivibrio ethanolgignens TaxID=290052 RepID=A0A0V8QEU5_9FIRM|nr:hypothetical protein [Acetivibrio ethanolgignens]KSV59072.1 hypothetical protein ASU35_01785 [Acetivibrio ethanolgignens]
MLCKNCGANIGSETSECPYCGTRNEQEPTQQAANVAPVQKAEIQKSSNPLLGKEYAFSGNDLIIRGRWGVKYNVTVGEDRLNFETVPAKKNKLPAVMLEDIMAIQESFHMRTFNIVLATLGILCGLAGGGIWCWLIPVVVFLLYRERKMKIHLRNGNILTIYSDNKGSIIEFIDDMRKITKIK